MKGSVLLSSHTLFLSQFFLALKKKVILFGSCQGFGKWWFRFVKGASVLCHDAILDGIFVRRSKSTFLFWSKLRIAFSRSALLA
jgi:hypothetical protein